MQYMGILAQTKAEELCYFGTHFTPRELALQEFGTALVDNTFRTQLAKPEAALKHAGAAAIFSPTHLMVTPGPKLPASVSLTRHLAPPPQEMAT
jgi:hypothetical protein